MKIALDAMGGDHAPVEIVKGAVEAVNNKGIHVILVGMQDAIENELKKYSYNHDLIEIVHASEVIEMDEHAATSFRKKKDASVTVANKLVADGIANAVVAAGSTGAAMTASLLKIGRIKGVERPAIALGLMARKGFVVLLDGGANADCSPEQLVQFAVMGEVYASVLKKKDRPTVALLNIGEEEVKGNQVVQKAHQLLKNTDLNFIGNCEGRDIPTGEIDVIVCDGFIGNIVLKLTEGLSIFLFDMIKEALTSSFISKIGALLAMPALKGLKKKLDYRETGGALLLGVNGVSIIAHGSSNARAIENAIYKAVQFSEAGMIEAVAKKINASNAAVVESEANN